MSKTNTQKTGKPLSIKLYGELCYQRYREITKKEKGQFLAGLACDYQCTRQHARRVMRQAVLSEGGSKLKESKPAKLGRKPLYANDDQAVWWLQTLWVGLNYPNTKLLPTMLKEWLPFFNEAGFTEDVRTKILKMSGSTMEKLLRAYKREHGKKHFAATRNKGRLKRMQIRIPQREINFKITGSGYFEGDTVAHCGNRLIGKHGWTLNSVCIHSAWTESEGFLGKEEERIVESLILIRQRLPFPMKGWHTDCGSEFLNEAVTLHLEDPKNYVTQTHGRAYKKNDHARVEQKNWTQVRQSLGYDRVEDQKVVDCMNDIYRNEFRILRNFFTPTLKQKSKIRVGSKYKRKFEVPKTPYERVMEDASVSQNIKDGLRVQKDSYNPFLVKRALDQKLKFFEKLLQNQNKNSEINKACVTPAAKDAA